MTGSETMFNDAQLVVVAVVVVFFGGVYLWLRQRVHAFDRKYGPPPTD